MMHWTDKASGSLFSRVDLAARIPWRQPLRSIRQLANEALASLDATFKALCTDFGRPSMVPERLIRAGLIRIPHSVRSKRQLMGQMQHNLLFRWFEGRGIERLRQQPRPAAGDVTQTTGIQAHARRIERRDSEGEPSPQ